MTTKRKGDNGTGVAACFDRARIKREEPQPSKKLSDDYLSQAHRVCTEYLHCPTLFGSNTHSRIEEAVARALVAAFHRGKKSGR